MIRRPPRCGGFSGRAIDFRRARAITRNQDCSLAASIDAVLEVDQRGLSSRSQYGRSDPRRWVPNQCRGNRVYERTEAVDLHVSRLGDEVGDWLWGILGKGTKPLHCLYPKMSPTHLEEPSAFESSWQQAFRPGGISIFAARSCVAPHEPAQQRRSVALARRRERYSSSIQSWLSGTQAGH